MCITFETRGSLGDAMGGSIEGKGHIYHPKYVLLSLSETLVKYLSVIVRYSYIYM